MPNAFGYTSQRRKLLAKIEGSNGDLVWAKLIGLDPTNYFAEFQYGPNNEIWQVGAINGAGEGRMDLMIS